MEKTPPDNSSNQLPVNEPKKKPKIYVFIALIILLIISNTTTYILVKNNSVETPVATSNQEDEVKDDLPKETKPVSFNWEEVRSSNLYLSPSYIKLRQNEDNKYLSCLKFDGHRDLNSIKPLIEDKQELVDGLMEIEDHTFTTPIKNEAGNSLEPIIAKYEIKYTNICGTTGKYLVLFLTTQKKQAALNFVSPVYAAGGWLGDSHLAIIENGETKIYERFPFEADLITLLKEGKKDVLMRFAAYYNCGNITSLTDKHIFIACSGNFYSMDIELKTFEELAICGSKIKNGTYMTSDKSCFDKNGLEYFFQAGGID
jgi:hypothetical protein